MLTQRLLGLARTSRPGSRTLPWLPALLRPLNRHRCETGCRRCAARPGTLRQPQCRVRSRLHLGQAAHARQRFSQRTVRASLKDQVFGAPSHLQQQLRIAQGLWQMALSKVRCAAQLQQRQTPRGQQAGLVQQPVAKLDGFGLLTEAHTFGHDTHAGVGHVSGQLSSAGAHGCRSRRLARHPPGSAWSRSRPCRRPSRLHGHPAWRWRSWR